MIKKIAYILLAILSIEVIFLALKYQKQTNELNELKIYLNSEEKQIDISKLLLVEISDWKSNDRILINNILNKDSAIIFYFSTTCSSCDEISQIWNSIFYRYKANFKILGLTYDSAELIYAYINKNSIEFPIFRISKITEDIRSIFSHSPRTIIIKKIYSLGIFDNLQPLNIDAFDKSIDHMIKED
jgi:hypothetical protein